MTMSVETRFWCHISFQCLLLVTYRSLYFGRTVFVQNFFVLNPRLWLQKKLKNRIWGLCKRQFCFTKICLINKYNIRKSRIDLISWLDILTRILASQKSFLDLCTFLFSTLQKSCMKLIFNYNRWSPFGKLVTSRSCTSTAYLKCLQNERAFFLTIVINVGKN